MSLNIENLLKSAKAKAKKRADVFLKLDVGDLVVYNPEFIIGSVRDYDYNKSLFLVVKKQKPQNYEKIHGNSWLWPHGVIKKEAFRHFKIDSLALTPEEAIKALSIYSVIEIGKNNNICMPDFHFEAICLAKI